MAENYAGRLLYETKSAGERPSFDAGEGDVVKDETFGPSAKVLEPDDKVMELLDVLRRHLSMDVAVLGMWDKDLLVVQVISGDGSSFGLAPGVTIRRSKELYEDLRALGLPSVSADTKRDAHAATAPMVRNLDVGSYASAELVDSHGQLYGLLCCLAHQPHPGIRERDCHFVRMVAEFLQDSLIDLRRMWETRSRASRAICGLIDGGGPRIVYQPIVRLGSGALVGVEALSRFPPRCGDEVHDTPGWFRSAWLVGLGIDLEMAAIHHAIEELPGLPPGIRLALNASPSTVTGGLVELLCDLRDPYRVVMEVTEHENCAGNPDLVRAIDCLRDLGVRIAVDDTGAGYSGLEQLLRLRPDVIKLDYLITRGIDRDLARRTIATGLVRFTEEIGGAVVAEGIETIAERDAVVRAGVPYGQGYLYGKPAPIAVITERRRLAPAM
ncbi:EAL domain-containing protein [Frankia sp. CNm7]|uniref:EAL domain-containing protein n=1 Tax=Frankia nepalensis TaxID=1836974 RepID=A0A937UUF0_9ACTN|nr:EAL domain-containing protein [Frankia nepalensis]MBL7498262.1 EAL domain-containing protein [Frankia nepalensis]MBL7509558.1 EAL domain-containing protein [Frankia nepalensis]MBL7518973.1 EAL domain-containing protein [Frankia nepalensis]MBL7632190.1 EAL domain-containing protein [Frankia nepalensis]